MKFFDLDNRQIVGSPGTRVVLAFLILIPSVVAASSFEGRLFYTPGEREEIERLAAPGRKEVDRAITRVQTTVAASPLLSFDGVTGVGDSPSIWINKAPWNRKKIVKGVKHIEWSAGQRRLLVTVKSGGRFTLSVGQCLMRDLRTLTCGSAMTK